LVLLRSVVVYMIACIPIDKKVVGVFVRFRAPFTRFMMDAIA
jgi:hypothetical protein